LIPVLGNEFATGPTGVFDGTTVPVDVEVSDPVDVVLVTGGDVFVTDGVVSVTDGVVSVTLGVVTVDVGVVSVTVGVGVTSTTGQSVTDGSGFSLGVFAIKTNDLS
jgi:hypothetical protein